MIEPPCTERYARWCERSEIPHIEEFPPTQFRETRALDSRQDHLDIISLARLPHASIPGVAIGVRNGAKGFLVLTVEATMKTVEESDVEPTCIYESLDEMRKYI